MFSIADLIGNISELTGIPVNELHSDTALYGSELVSSLMMLEIMAAIEKDYGIYIRPEELIADNFADIGKLRDFIERKQREDVPA
jgi:acyl carrier protein